MILKVMGFDKATESAVFIEGINFMSKEVLIRLHSGNIELRKESEIRIMVYTGVDDIHGVEIYTDDIVKIPDDYERFGTSAGEKYTIGFRDGSFRLIGNSNKDEKGFILESDLDLEIVGNINEEQISIESGDCNE